LANAEVHLRSPVLHAKPKSTTATIARHYCWSVSTTALTTATATATATKCLSDQSAQSPLSLCLFGADEHGCDCCQ
jgi:hypothetical protein